MMRLKDEIYITADEPVPYNLIERKEASPEAIHELLQADETLEDGFTRSQFFWFRLENGDLIAGFYPQDDAYFAFETLYP